MRSYELVIIHRPELAETDVRNAIGQAESALQANGAEMTNTEFWGKRRFAYEIDHLTEGYYSVLAFNAEGGASDQLERALSISDAVVRHKVIRMDNRKRVPSASQTG